MIRSSGTRGAIPLALIATLQWHLFNHTMRFISAVPAVAMGVAIGMLSSVVLQKQLNHHAKLNCNKPGISDTHRLVLVTRTAIGSAYACMHVRYLGN